MFSHSRDTLTVFGGTGLGYVRYSFVGSLVNCDDGDFCVNRLTINHNDEAVDVVSYGTLDPRVQTDGVLTFFTSDDHAIRFGVPFDLELTLMTAEALAAGDVSVSDFINRMTLSRLQVFDSAGRRIHFQIHSSSGAAYPVPEPTTGVAVAMAFLALCRSRFTGQAALATGRAIERQE